MYISLFIHYLPLVTFGGEAEMLEFIVLILLYCNNYQK